MGRRVQGPSTAMTIKWRDSMKIGNADRRDSQIYGRLYQFFRVRCAMQEGKRRGDLQFRETHENRPCKYQRGART